MASPGLPYPSYNLAPSGLCGFTPSGALAVHTDGTIFAYEGNSVIGINPITGAQTFSVSIPVPTPAFSPANCSSGTSYGVANMTGFLSNFIIAGDGNAYVAFAYNEFNDCTIVKTHLRLLQLSSSGASNVLTILDAVPLNYPPDATGLGLGMITNADTGVVLTWGLDFLQGEASFPTQYGMAITTGTSVSILNGPILPGQDVQNGTTPVFPVLQAQDGSFVGSVTFVNDGVGQTNMVAFDQGGNVLWMVPNEQPLMATADGGVIGQSGITYDQNGNATGQISSPLPTYSWEGNAYQIASTDLVLANPLYFAVSFWAFQGATPARNNTAYFPRDSISNSKVSTLLNETFWKTKLAPSHCQQVLANPLGMQTLGVPYTLQVVQQKQTNGTTNWYDIGNPQVGSLTLGQVTGGQYGGARTLSDYLNDAGATAGTANFGFLNQTAIVLQHSVLTQPHPEFTLVHELIFHAYAGLQDGQIFGNTYFQQQGLWRPSGSTATSNISTWMSTDCNCTPGNPAAPSCTANTAPW